MKFGQYFKRVFSEMTFTLDEPDVKPLSLQETSKLNAMLPMIKFKIHDIKSVPEQEAGESGGMPRIVSKHKEDVKVRSVEFDKILLDLLWDDKVVDTIEVDRKKLLASKDPNKYASELMGGMVQSDTDDE